MYVRVRVHDGVSKFAWYVLNGCVRAWGCVRACVLDGARVSACVLTESRTEG